MPELPEVQTIADDLNRKVSGRRITGFWTDWPKVVKLPSAKKLADEIKGARIERIERIGKNIIFYLNKNRLLLVHQKMTGHLMVGKWALKSDKMESLLPGPQKERVNQYIHALFYLDDGWMIALSDMRKFARIAFGSKEEILSLPDIKKLGPDALEIAFTEFEERILARRKAIKLTLMDPTVVAGIGNIYADDILWSARVHPLKPANELRPEELKEIFEYTKKILKRAVKLRGTSVGDYRDADGREGRYAKHLLVYRRTGSPCKRCGAAIERVRLGGRSAHFCPECQKI